MERSRAYQVPFPVQPPPPTPFFHDSMLCPSGRKSFHHLSHSPPRSPLNPPSCSLLTCF